MTLVGQGGLGGGVFEHVGNDAVITLDHTIVADNAAGYGGLDSPDISGDVTANWSLIENTSGASISGANNVTGVNPQLGPLQDNGGPTFTRMIPATGPAFNAGDPAFGPPPNYDQRGLARVSGPVAPGPRRIDIGAVERQIVPSALPAVVTSSTKFSYRESLTTGPSTMGPFTFGTSPLVPIMGDWDGDGDRTPGYFKGGVFTLSNNADGSGTPVVFTFGDSRGFPVVGNWDGDADDEVAVFRNGTWEKRPNTNTGVVAGTSFVYGSGVWPATTPVAGDWNGDGTDGIGYYMGNGAGVGTWTLRQTAASGGTNVTPFNFEAAQPGYPVVGDWDGDKFDTLWAPRPAPPGR